MKVGETLNMSAHSIEVYGANMAAQLPVYKQSKMGRYSEEDMFVHSGLHTVLCLFVLQARASVQHPRALTEVDTRMQGVG